MLNVPDTVPTGSATGNSRNKVVLKRGRGLMDWVRLGRSSPDLAGTNGKLLKITQEELMKHNTRKDAWMVLKGNVYNITPYFEYHPGGEDELMKGAGIDATDLFNEVHKWVNFTSMLQNCLVGTLVESKPFFAKPNFLPLMKIGKSLEPRHDGSLLSGCITFPTVKSPSNKNPIAPQQGPMRLPPPKYDWFQTKTLINVAIYTKWKEIQKCHVFVLNKEQHFRAVIRIQHQVFTMHIELFKPVEPEFELRIGNGMGKVDILMKKALPGVRWTALGSPLKGNNEVVFAKNKENEFLKFKISEKVKLTHNTFLIVFDVPCDTYFGVPIGHHVYLRIPDCEKLNDVVKPYTPVITPFIVSSTNDNAKDECGSSIKIFLKVYPDGQLTPLLAELSEGDEVDVSLPEGSFTPNELRKATVESSQLLLLGAGTGITPHIKLMLEALKNEVKTVLVTFNKTKDDIPWRIELDSLVVTHSKLLRVFHVLSNPAPSWNGHCGHVRRDLLEELLPAHVKDEDTHYICVCGTAGFTKLTLSLLEEMGYSKESIFAFTG